MTKILSIVLLVLMTSIASYAQGIKFEDPKLSWTEIKAKAKREHKYIFMDCFATWCGPCKAMDRGVFPQKEVGDYFNAHFINVKVQMDWTVQDNKDVKNWYKDVHALANDYDVHSYPSYLFFLPDGTAAHKVVGSKTTETFLVQAAESLKPETQYYTLISDWQAKKNDTAYLSRILKSALNAGDSKNAKLIVDAKLSSSEHPLTKEMMESILATVKSTNDKGFYLLLSNMEKADGFGLSKRTYDKLNAIAYHDDIETVVQRDGSKTNWKELAARLASRYPNLYNKHDTDSSFLSKIFDIARFEGEKPDLLIISDAYQHTVNDKFAAANIRAMLDVTTSQKDNSFKFLFENAAKMDQILGNRGTVSEKLSRVILLDTLIQMVQNDLARIDYHSISLELDKKYPGLKSYLDARSKQLFYIYLLKDINNAVSKYPMEVNWYLIEKKLKKKFVNYDYHHALLMAQCQYYNNKKKWDRCGESAYTLMKNHGSQINDSELNTICWYYVFLNCRDQKVIREAIKWMKKYIGRQSDYEATLDTYANLLYKAGDRHEAIQWQTQAAILATGTGQETEIKDHLEKMKQNQKTWSDESPVKVIN